MSEDELARLEARIAKLESWPGRLLDWTPYLAIAALFTVLMTAIIFVPSRRDRLDDRLDRIESALDRIELELRAP